MKADFYAWTDRGVPLPKTLDFAALLTAWRFVEPQISWWAADMKLGILMAFELVEDGYPLLAYRARNIRLGFIRDPLLPKRKVNR